MAEKIKTKIDWDNVRNKLEVSETNGLKTIAGHAFYEEIKFCFSVKEQIKSAYKIRGRVYAVDESGMVLKKNGQAKLNTVRNYTLKILRKVLEPVLEVRLLPYLNEEEIETFNKGIKERKENRNIDGITVNNEHLIELAVNLVCEDLLKDLKESIREHIQGYKNGRYSIPDELYKKLLIYLKERFQLDIVTIIDKAIPVNDQMFDISSDVYVQTDNLDDIKVVISKRIVDLHSSSFASMRNNLSLRANPDMITPQLAAEMYGKTFIVSTSKTKNETTISKYLNNIKSTCDKLSVIPMSKFSERKVMEEIKKYSIQGESLRRLIDFWNYCVSTGKCTGNNPIVRPQQKRVSADSRRAQAERITFLNLEQQDALYEYLLKHHNKYTFALALSFASGLTFKDVSIKTCGDLVFLEDGTIVLKHFNKEYGFTQNYTAPINPNAREVILKEYAILKEKFQDRINKIYIMKQNSRNEPIRFDLLRAEAQRVLLKIGIENESFKAARNIGTEKSAAGAIIMNTMKYNLNEICNLSGEDGTQRFLLKKSLAGNITADNYVSYVSSEGRSRLAGIIKCLQKDEKIEKRYNKVIGDNGSVTETFRPERKRSYLRLAGSITVPAKSEIEIACEHGVEGTINMIEDN